MVLARHADLVGEVRERVWATGQAAASVVEGKEQAGAKYRDYFEHTEPLETMPGHRVLAVLRGETEGILQLGIDAGDDAVYEGMVRRAFDLPESAWMDQASGSGPVSLMRWPAGSCRVPPTQSGRSGICRPSRSSSAPSTT